MKYSQTLRLQLMTVFMATLAFSTISAGQIISHDLLVTEDGRYKVIGDDPYIIFNPQQVQSEASHLIIDLGDDPKTVPLTLFFNSKDDLFHPRYKINFTAASFPAALELPEDIVINNLSRLRLDVEQCPDCSINFASLPLLTSEPRLITAAQITDVQNGLNRLSSASALISTIGWQLNDIDGELSRFNISGDDPFLVSPRLSASTSHLQGVYFKLTAPSSGEVWNHYQLFYQTERHGFTPQASATVRLGDSDDGLVEFMLPLDFLSQERPSDTVLERLRLDLPEIQGQWSLLEVRLVHQDQAADTKRLVPAQLIQIKQQSATGLALLKKVLLNVASDSRFSIGYLLLLILTSLFFIRAYRSNE